MFAIAKNDYSLRTLLVFCSLSVLLTLFLSKTIIYNQNSDLLIDENEDGIMNLSHTILTTSFENTGLPQTEFEMIKTRFAKRRRTLQSRCKNVRQQAEKNYMKYFLGKRMLYEPHHDFMVCLVAKSGATTWRKHFYNIERNKKNRETEYSRLTDKKSIALSKTTKKMLTVRHPLERIISMYNGKFDGGKLTEPSRRSTKMWYKMAQRLLHQNLGPENNKSISFEQFIEFILYKGISEDRHVRSVFSNCVPCTVDYDFILHQETFNEDLNYVFTVLNVTESDVNVHMNNKSGGAKKDIDGHFKNLPPELLKKVKEYLKKDFYLFDYPIPDYFPN